MLVKMLARCNIQLYCRIRLGIAQSSVRTFAGSYNPDEEPTDANDKILDWIPRFIDTFGEVDRANIEFPPEVQARHNLILNRFVTEERKRQNTARKSLSLKVYFMMDAIRALPPTLQKEARVRDLTPFPQRDIPSYTPPIKDFDPSKVV